MRTRRFLEELGLGWDEGNEFTVNLLEDDALCATGSRQGNLLKCIGVSPRMQGEGLAATVVTRLVKDALAHGHTQLFLYTKPGNAALFRELGFYPVVETPDVAFLENRRGGLASFLRALPAPAASGTVAAIVANCDPVTNGHRYLFERAAAQCGHVCVFVLSEDRGFLPADDRLRLVREATADIPNLTVYPTGPYLISAATFPQYFLKDKLAVPQIHCELDLAIFCRHFAPHFGITRRYVGEEPLCAVTRQYNQQLKLTLPRHGIEVVETKRLSQDGQPVSASAVRQRAAVGDWEGVRALVPPACHRCLYERQGLPAEG